MVLYGSGGHAKVVLESLVSCGESVEGIFDDRLSGVSFKEIEVLGVYDPEKLLDHPLIVTIGNNEIRRKISLQVTHPFGTVIDRRALLSPQSQIGEGSVVMASCIIQPDTQIGKHVIINTGAVVEHDCRVADYVHIGPRAVLCGLVEVGEGTLVGANAVVAPLVKIGKWCQISAGSSVLEDVPDYSVVMGVPGKIVKVIEPNSVTNVS